MRVWALGLLLLCAWTPISGGTIEGTVTDEAGAGIFEVDLDFRRTSDGVAVLALGNDDTDITGFYSVTVPDDIYDVTFNAPPGRLLAGHREKDVVLTGTTHFDLVLRQAWFVSGTVLQANSLEPAVGVDIDFKDKALDRGIFVANDLTDLDGHYSILVPIGIYNIEFEYVDFTPPLFAPTRLREVSIEGFGDVSLPTVLVEPGFVVQGQVIDDLLGAGVAGADIDFIRRDTGEKQFTPRDDTDVTGFYAVVVRSGSYDIEYEPPKTIFPLMAATISFNVAVGSDLSLGLMVVPTGFTLNGNVSDVSGSPIRKVDVNVNLTSDGTKVPTPGDNTNASGNYVIVAPSGTFDFTYTTKKNPQYVPTVIPSFTVSVDTQMPEVLLTRNDTDNDGYDDLEDRCPLHADPTNIDGDLDGVGDICDNCAFDPNPRQEDNDGDGAGNVCDADDDGDLIPDSSDGDRDGDGIINASDNCPGQANPGQWDFDGNGVGDACDPHDGEVDFLAAATADGFVLRQETNATFYYVYRNELRFLSTINYGKCRFLELEAPFFRDESIPDLGRGFFYLATTTTTTMTTTTTEASLGRRTGGDIRPNLRNCGFTPEQE